VFVLGSTRRACTLLSEERLGSLLRQTEDSALDVEGHWIAILVEESLGFWVPVESWEVCLRLHLHRIPARRAQAALLVESESLSVGAEKMALAIQGQQLAVRAFLPPTLCPHGVLRDAIRAHEAYSRRRRR
jgi:hypothetical protein